MQRSKQTIEKEPPLKRPRGRPRKQPLEAVESTNTTEGGQPRVQPDVLESLRKLIKLKRISSYKQALEELNEIHSYLCDSIDFGELEGCRKYSCEEL